MSLDNYSYYLNLLLLRLRQRLWMRLLIKQIHALRFRRFFRRSLYFLISTFLVIFYIHFTLQSDLFRCIIYT